MTVSIESTVEAEGPPPGCAWCGGPALHELLGDPGHWIRLAICDECLTEVARFHEFEVGRDPMPMGALEIAKLLGVQPNTVHGWRHRGLLPPEAGMVSGQPWWPSGQIAAWAANRSFPGALLKPLMAYPATNPPRRERGRELPAGTEVELVAVVGTPAAGGRVTTAWVVFQAGDERLSAPRADFEAARRA